MAEPPQQQQQPPAPQLTGAARFVAGVFGVAFAAIGLTVIGTLWFGDGMGDPPLIFKLVGSFIALVFVAMGGTIAFGAITGGASMAQQQPSTNTTTTAAANSSPSTPRAYTCPHCGGGLDRGADVSPMGDVKCGFCGRWFNVHGRNSG